MSEYPEQDPDDIFEQIIKLREQIAQLTHKLNELLCNTFMDHEGEVISMADYEDKYRG